MVVPSMDLSVRSLGCTSAISERTLMLHFSNCLRPAPLTMKPTAAATGGVGVGVTPRENKVLIATYQYLFIYLLIE